MVFTPRPWVAALTPYEPGRPAVRGEVGLASNELADGPTSAVIKSILDAVGTINRYPDPLAGTLRDAIAKRHSIDPECVLVGNGSDELIHLLVLAYAAFGGSVVCASPPYQLHQLASQALGANVQLVPLDAWRHDLTAMAGAECDIAFICNPHNPTGTTVSQAELIDFLRSCRAQIVVVDEAYIDFADEPGKLSMLKHAADGRLVVLRTFSKLYGLAGLRVGYLVAANEVITTLRGVRQPFSVNSLAQAAACAAVAQPEVQGQARAQVIGLRSRLTSKLEACGYEVVPSQSNFVLILTGKPSELVERLAVGGIVARPGRSLGVADAVRLTVPSEAEFSRLEKILQ